MNFESEESTSDRNWGLSVSADRITPEWKLTIGADLTEDHSRFNLDEKDDEALTVVRKNWSVNWLGVNSLTDHWSAGIEGHLLSSTFTNIDYDVTLAPAIERNSFPTRCTRAARCA